MITLTRNEKKLLIVPSCLGAAILALLAYSVHLAAEQDALRDHVLRLNRGISQDVQHLREVQDFARDEQRLRLYEIDQWLPAFDNILEVRLYASQKALQELSAVGAVYQDWDLSDPADGSRPHIAEFHLTAVFPSYTALVMFLEAVEETPPPLLPQQVELIKTGMTIDASFTFYFGYRLRDETI